MIAEKEKALCPYCDKPMRIKFDSCVDLDVAYTECCDVGFRVSDVSYGVAEEILLTVIEDERKRIRNKRSKGFYGAGKR